MPIINKIETSFLQLYGRPAFGVNVENRDATLRFQLWFYPPPSDFSEENNVIYTVGLSEQTFTGPCPKIELSFQFPGKFRRWQLEKLGKILGTLIHDTLKVTNFTPNLLLTTLKHPIMPAMGDILVIEGAGMRPLWMELEDKTCIRLLHLLPVYRTEVPLIRQMGLWNTYRQFIEHKINFLTPNRTGLTEAHFHPDNLKLAREVAVYQKPPSGEQIWQQITLWYQHNAPGIELIQLEELPFSKHDWPEALGLTNGISITALFDGEISDQDWLCQYWEGLYSGCYKYIENHGLVLNPHYFPN